MAFFCDLFLLLGNIWASSIKILTLFEDFFSILNVDSTVLQMFHHLCQIYFGN